ncbi:hypothetical protein MJM83_28875, partial [Salmonella enterica subsp. enterica serovar Montevideo]|nr:hypothetical protein [Salmonella enterica subsp. enterica serovar Montevideo]
LMMLCTGALCILISTFAVSASSLFYVRYVLNDTALFSVIVLVIALMPGCRQQPGASPIPFIAVWRLTYAFIFYDVHQRHSPHCF